VLSAVADVDGFTHKGGVMDRAPLQWCSEGRGQEQQCAYLQETHALAYCSRWEPALSSFVLVHASVHEGCGHREALNSGAMTSRARSSSALTSRRHMLWRIVTGETQLSVVLMHVVSE